MIGRQPAGKSGGRQRKRSSMSKAQARAVVTPAAGPLLLGSEVDIAGSVYIDAAVLLDGVIDGEIRCTELELAVNGRVRGRIVAERVTIYGVVSEGAIYASVLNLRPGCQVEAEIYHEHLQLDQGSYFDGKSRRVTDPTSLAPN